MCDQAAGEACPVWPGMPAKAHWSAPDPGAYTTDPEQAKRVIRQVFHQMQRRIVSLMSLPVEKLDRMSLEGDARAIADKP